MDTPHLTIAIPTYNRNQILVKNLQYLVPQLNNDCKLVIIDNHSPIPVEETVKEHLPILYGAKNCVILRNATNIGGNANLLRCIEVCDTEWLWILGDDDKIDIDAVQTIFSAISAHPDCSYLNFQAGKSQEVLTYGLDDFITNMGLFKDVLLISSNVYRRNDMLEYLSFSYHFTYSCAPHFVILLQMLLKNAKCLLSNRVIVHWELPPVEHQWSILHVGLGLMLLLEFSMPKQTRRRLAKKILESLPQLDAFFLQIVLHIHRNPNDQDTAIHLYNQICNRLYYYERNVILRTKIGIYKFLLYFPSFAYFLLSVTYRFLRKKNVVEIAQAQWSR